MTNWILESVTTGLSFKAVDTVVSLRTQTGQLEAPHYSTPVTTLPITVGM